MITIPPAAVQQLKASWIINEITARSNGRDPSVEPRSLADALKRERLSLSFFLNSRISFSVCHWWKLASAPAHPSPCSRYALYSNAIGIVEMCLSFQVRINGRSYGRRYPHETRAGSSHTTTNTAAEHALYINKKKNMRLLKKSFPLL